MVSKVKPEGIYKHVAKWRCPECGGSVRTQICLKCYIERLKQIDAEPALHLPDVQPHHDRRGAPYHRE